MHPTLRRLALALLLVAACGPELPEHPVVHADGDSVNIPLAEVDDGRVHFYSFPTGGTRVNFMVRTDGTGTLQAHLDACYGCYNYKMGYVAEDRALVCRACRLEYPIEDEVWDFVGACAPISVHSSVEGSHLVIERADLERATRYF